VSSPSACDGEVAAAPAADGGALFPIVNNRSSTKARIPSATCTASVITSLAGMRSVSTRRSRSQASRSSSRAGLSPMSCARPSISIARLARAQKKSRAYGPAACCLRKRMPRGEPRNCCHRSISGSDISRRRRLARATVRLGLAGRFKAPLHHSLRERSPSPSQDDGEDWSRPRSFLPNDLRWGGGSRPSG